jgi:hypothetical protein
MTTPSGKLAWGQAATYDAVDDRRVIAAVTRNRTGLTALPTITALSGLNLQVSAGWLGVVSCGDGTSAVVGSALDLTVTGTAGPATGTRTDVIWVDVQPDSGTWSVSVIAQSATSGRTGLLLATLTVPANATLASQMTIVPADPLLERRLLTLDAASNTATFNATTWATATGSSLDSKAVLMTPGNWYRVRYSSTATQLVSGPSGALYVEGRIGIGYRTQGQPASSAALQRTAAIPWVQTGLSYPAEITYVFRHAPTDVLLYRVFTGRIWSTLGNSSYKAGNPTGDPGNLQTLTVEDMGS